VARRVLSALVLFGAVPIGVLALSYRTADVLGEAVGRAAALAGALLRTRALRDAPPPAPNPPPAPPEAPEASPALEAPKDESAKEKRGAARAAKRQRRKEPERPPGERVVYLSERTVLALAERGVVPTATPVAAHGARPAGLRLSGVSALGVGMRDGDVITSVLGAPVTSVESAVERVIAARARQVRVISAEFWRGTERFRLAVEQPYVGDLHSGREGTRGVPRAAP